MSNISSKRAVESFLVAKPAQTALPTNATAFVNSGTNNINLADGQLGLLNSSIYGTGTFNQMLTGPTATTAPVLTLVQGNANSGNAMLATSTYPLAVRTYEASAPMNVRNKITVTKQAYREPSFSTWLIGAPVGTAGAVNVASNTYYSIGVDLRGRRMQEMYSNEGAVLRTGITTPDMTSTGLNYSTAQAVDYILTRLGVEINKNSKALVSPANSKFNLKYPVFAVGIDSKGTSTTRSTIGGTGATLLGGTVGNSGLAAGALAAGQSVHVSGTGSNARFVTFTTAMMNSITALGTAMGQNFGDHASPSTWKITPLELTQAGSVTAGNGEVDMLLLFAVDETPVYADYIPQVKVRLGVSLPSGFDNDTVRYQEIKTADEGQGLPRQLSLYWRNTQGQRLYNLSHTEDPIINYPNPIDLASTGYVVYTFHHGDYEQIDIANLVYSPHKEVVCVPRYSSGTTTNALISSFDTAINGWLSSAVNSNNIISLD